MEKTAVHRAAEAEEEQAEESCAKAARRAASKDAVNADGSRAGIGRKDARRAAGMEEKAP